MTQITWQIKNALRKSYYSACIIGVERVYARNQEWFVPSSIDNTLEWVAYVALQKQIVDRDNMNMKFISCFQISKME